MFFLLLGATKVRGWLEMPDDRYREYLPSEAKRIVAVRANALGLNRYLTLGETGGRECCTLSCQKSANRY
jgi:hypothetical protein